MLKFVALVALAATLAFATSTTPRVSDAKNLKTTYLLQINEGAWVTTLSNEDCSKKVYMPCKVLASIQYNASNNDLGWDFVKVTAKDSYYHAGWIEGHVTAASIKKMIPSIPKASTAAATWVNEHIAYMTNKSKMYGSDDKFWGGVGKLLDQMRGISDGFQNATNTTLSFLDVFMINFADEIGDVEIHVKHQAGMFKKDELLPMDPNRMHCSALIKPTHDDLFMSHDTWSVFAQMAYRAYKVYVLEGVTVTLSGYPATIASGDDWYMTSHELAIQETTNGVMNTSLYTDVVPQTVSEFLRVMTATYNTRTGEEWTRYFARENSGTYNNQYMVVDWKRFVPGTDIIRDTLWVAEQLPGIIERQDMSKVLQEKGYWASYNIPYFYKIYDLSGYKQYYEEQGNFWSYTKYARPEIFHRNQSMITELSDMMHMMRYNDYKVDPFSIIQNCTGATNNVCNPKHSSMLSIASRGDLMKVYNASEMMAHYGPLASFVAQGCFGALDSKIASYKNRHDLTAYVVSGPTNDQQPTFSWGENSVCPLSMMPPGSPQTFDFPWVEFRI